MECQIIFLKSAGKVLEVREGCPKESLNLKMERKTRVHALHGDNEDSDFDSHFEIEAIDVTGKIETVEGKVNKKYTNKIMATFLINGQRIMHIDCGAIHHVPLSLRYVPIETGR